MFSSTEIRWFFPPRAGLLGRLEATFRASMPETSGLGVPVVWSAERTDRYLVLENADPASSTSGTPPGEVLGIKLRASAGSASRLEIKGRTEAHGKTTLLAGVSGEVESWVKWSLPEAASPAFSRLLRHRTNTWAVAKRRLLRMFELERDGEVTEIDVSGDQPPLTSGIGVELTRVRRPDRPDPESDVVWTIGFEAFPAGPRTRSALAVFCASFLVDISGMVPLADTHSLSYPGWLSRQPQGNEVVREE